MADNPQEQQQAQGGRAAASVRRAQIRRAQAEAQLLPRSRRNPKNLPAPVEQDWIDL